MNWPIPKNSEWLRINQLPIWIPTAEDTAHWREALHAFCRRPGSTARLLDPQVCALMQWAKLGYLFGSLPVGSGKTLLTFLAPRFFPHKRAVLMIPAGLRVKTFHELEAVYKADWAVAEDLVILNYEQMQTAKSADVLERLEPDILICDEADALKNMDAARTRRFLRFCRARPNLRLMLLSGSFMRRSLKDFWHLVLMVCGRDSPVPVTKSEADRWAKAIDAGIDDSMRPAAGALREWCAPHERSLPDVMQARAGFRNRFATAPGILLSKDVPILTELVVQERPASAPPVVQDALHQLYTSWETPNGDVLETGFDVWRYARELLSGFWYRWDPPPPAAWLLARREWHKFVRAEIQRELPGLDSPKQVALAHRQHPLLIRWQEIRSTYTINSIPMWISDYLIQDATQWLRETPDSLVWVEHRAVGERLSQLAGVPYFGRGEEASHAILRHRGPAVISIHAHKKGKNLQYQFCNNLVMTPPTTSSDWEQMLGRTYRQGQEHTVHTWVYLHEEALQRAMQQALDEADAVSVTKGVTQRLTRAAKYLPSLDSLQD